MSKNQGVRAVICPSCGGNVNFAPYQNQTTCKFCGTLIERERPVEPPPPVVQSPVVQRPVTANPPLPVRQTSGCLAVWVVVGLIVTIGIGFFVFAAAESGGQSIFSTVHAMDTALLVPAGDGQLAEVLLLTYNSDTEKRGLAYVSPISQTARWQNELFDQDTYSAAMAAGEDLIYATDKMQLLAMQRENGQIAWQAALADEVSSSCQGCLQQVGQHLIALAKDGTLHSFDAQTGRVVWSQRLSGSPDRLSVIGDRLMIMDRAEGDAYLSLIDPATGKEVQHLTPQCTAHSKDLSDSLDTYAPALIDREDQALYLFYGTFTACVQRWDVAHGKLLWQAGLQDASFTIGDSIFPLMSSDSIFVNGRNRLYAVSKKDGKSRELINDPDYEFVPWALHDNTLIVRAKRTRGSTRYEWWGVDIPSGKRLWQHPLEEAEPLDEPDQMVGLIDQGDSGFTAHLTPAGLVTVLAQADPHQLILETLNPDTGTSVGQKKIDLNVNGSFYSVPSVLGWLKEMGYFIIESRLYVVDLAAGAATYIW